MISARITAVFAVFMLFIQIVIANPQLDEAHRLCNQLNYQKALEIYQSIDKQCDDPSVQREARFYIGSCKRHLHDYWGAISAYEVFLNHIRKHYTP
ncbi:MAG: hypothetical protein HQM10_18865 [Candidatus Riflebacteria bacterium]|nr:hypothetical protein [Candidatus Riflebacteria bacterium]